MPARRTHNPSTTPTKSVTQPAPPAEITSLHPTPTTPSISPPESPPSPISNSPESFPANPALSPSSKVDTTTPTDATTQIDSTLTPIIDSDSPVITEETNTTKWLVAIVVLILLIIAVAGGAFYYLTQYKFSPTKELLSPEANSTSTPSATDSASEPSPVSQSDSLEDITKDVENTNIEGLDQELQQIDKEL